MEQSPAILVSKLSKKYSPGAPYALKDLDLYVNHGEILGFLGPNGAGKSTTIRVLLGLLRKTHGDVQLFGKDPWKHSVELHKRLTYVPGDVSLWAGLSGGEVIDLFASLRGGIDKKRKAELLADFQLDAKKKCRTYSKGNRQKVALVAALASDAELYILDEPTSGLDPLMESVFQHHILELKKQHKTVLLSSHILAEVEALADRVTIIRGGTAVETGTLAELRHLSQHRVSAATAKPAKGLRGMTGISDFVLKENHVTFTVDHHNMGRAIEKLTTYGIESLTSEPPSLEELFMRHYDSKPERE